jgi:hypothetical protein
VPANAASGPETQTATTIRNIISSRRVCSFSFKQIGSLGAAPGAVTDASRSSSKSRLNSGANVAYTSKAAKIPLDGRDDVVAKREMIRDL